MPINYQNSKIYKIVPKNGDNICYVGSTALPTLAHRMKDHRSSYKNWKEGRKGKVMAFDLFDKYDISNCEILLIESYPCNTKDELRAREDYHIKNTPGCINKNGAIWDDKKAKARMQAHKKIEFATKINCVCGAITDASNKARHEKTRKHINYLANPNWIQDNKKAYVKKRLDENFNCECGSTVSLNSKLRHLKSKLHNEWVESQIQATAS